MEQGKKMLEVFMNPKKSRKILNGVAVLGIGIVVMAKIPALYVCQPMLLFVATMLGLADLVFGFVFLRCPHCRKLLNIRWLSQGICHNCGEKVSGK